jgi:unsaturated rhamnogalacturonyl hydrolase
MKSAIPQTLALAAVRKHLEVHGNFDRYPGNVTLHGLARLAVARGDAETIGEARKHLLPYVRGERPFHVNFPNQLCGGLGAAYLLWKGHLPEAREAVRLHAKQLMEEAPRNPQGIFSHPAFPGENRIWIDAAFTVTPFLLFAGLALNEPAYIEEAFQQTSKTLHVLRNPENGLLHQCQNFTGQLPGRISEDHWSRGNGWGLYALAELACHLPADHQYKAEAVELFRNQLQACAAVQNSEGLWHQEMTEKESYVETSGSGLMLYAIGAGLGSGLLDPSWGGRYEKGLAGLLAYISGDIDIYHACHGCLCPGQGTKLDYMATAPVVNDFHAFGPVVLAMGQAHILGIEQITKSH